MDYYDSNSAANGSIWLLMHQAKQADVNLSSLVCTNLRNCKAGMRCQLLPQHS